MNLAPYFINPTALGESVGLENDNFLIVRSLKNKDGIQKVILYFQEESSKKLISEQNNNIDKTYQLKHSGRIIRSIKSCKLKRI